MLEFRLPDLGEGMQEAEIRRWLVAPGDQVTIDQPMVEVETDKAVIEIPSPSAGSIASICKPAGSIAHLGDVLVTLETFIKPIEPVTKTINSPVTQHQPKSEQSIYKNGQSTNNAVASRILAAPAVRKRAFELGIDLTQVPATQSQGRITMEDLQSYLARSATAQNGEVAGTHLATLLNEPEIGADQKSLPVQLPSTPTRTEQAGEERVALSGLRRRIAEHMEQSWRTIPHAIAFDEVEASAIVELKKQLTPLAQQRGVHLTYLALFIKLLVPVLKEFGVFNAHFDGEKREIIYKQSYHLGIATDTPEGLLVPVLQNADRYSLLELAQQLQRLSEGARKRSLNINELSGSTFTITNIGSFGGSQGCPIINAPEVAILGFGRLQEKAIVEQGKFFVRPVLPLSLAFDHRIIDGAQGGNFLARFKDLINHPQQLWLDMI